jgi:hypothetical protein
LCSTTSCWIFGVTNDDKIYYTDVDPFSGHAFRPWHEAPGKATTDSKVALALTGTSLDSNICVFHRSTFSVLFMNCFVPATDTWQNSGNWINVGIQTPQGPSATEIPLHNGQGGLINKGSAVAVAVTGEDGQQWFAVFNPTSDHGLGDQTYSALQIQPVPNTGSSPSSNVAPTLTPISIKPVDEDFGIADRLGFFETSPDGVASLNVILP